jgi:hypothetical protein
LRLGRKKPMGSLGRHIPISAVVDAEVTTMQDDKAGGLLGTGSI